MIYITGDTHIPIDIEKLNSKNFDTTGLTKDDYVIICGDFGGIWNYKGPDKEEVYWLDWLENKPFTTLFVDGNHENFERLYKFEDVRWNGGRVHKIRDSILHLMRGQIFTIDNQTFFTMGGATSIDRGPLVGREEEHKNKIWWSEEIPSEEEMQEGRDNLSKYNNEVDYIITHCLPTSELKKLFLFAKGDKLNAYHEEVLNTVKYKHWYCGHYHKNIDLDNNITVLYDDIIKL